MSGAEKTKAGRWRGLAALALALALFAAPDAFAACSSPTGNAGDVLYSSTSNIMYYCNSAVWVNMGSAAGGTISSGTWNASTIGVPYGGTGATSQTTNGVAYYNGTSITTGTSFEFNGTDVSIGTTATGSLLNVNGGVSIGTSYVATAAPTNGLIILGSTGIGTSSPQDELSLGSGAILAPEFATTYASSLTVNWTNGNQQYVTLTGNPTISFSNDAAGQTLRLVVCQDGTGSRTVTWSGVTWTGGTAPTLTTTASKCDVMLFIATSAKGSLAIFGTSALNF